MDKGLVLWLTGLPGSGKTTIAGSLALALEENGQKVEILDGDKVRHNLSKDLGFTKHDREEHTRRVTYVSKLLSKHGVMVIVAFIAPYRAFRLQVRKEIDNYVEIYIKASIEECIRRDPKGLYKRALNGEIKGFTGIDDPYEEPLDPEIIVNTEKESVVSCTDKIMQKLLDIGATSVRSADLGFIRKNM